MKQWIAVACLFVLGTGLILAEKKTLNVTLKPVEGKNPPVMRRSELAAGVPGVIESMSSRYTMFLPSGTPVRATTTITMKEAAGAKAKAPTDEPCPRDGN